MIKSIFAIFNLKQLTFYFSILMVKAKEKFIELLFQQKAMVFLTF